MKRTFYLSILFMPSLLWAQDEKQTLPLDLFYEGKVALQNGDTIKGLIKYSLDDLLQVWHNHQTESFSAQKVSFFEIFDQSDQRVRQFYAVRYAGNGQYKTPVFFELISKGRLTVLSREKIHVITSRGPGFHQPTSETVIVNKYFLADQDGTITDFDGKKNKWYELMGNHANEIREYVKNNKLDFDKKYQLKNIIDHFNSLPNQSIFSSAKTSDFSIQR